LSLSKTLSSCSLVLSGFGFSPEPKCNIRIGAPLLSIKHQSILKDDDLMTTMPATVVCHAEADIALQDRGQSKPLGNCGMTDMVTRTPKRSYDALHDADPPRRSRARRGAPPSLWDDYAAGKVN
jgi:hypothetical protein